LSVADSLRKNAAVLLTGLVTGILVLVMMRQSSGEPLFQPQSDFGIVLGALLVTTFVVFRDLRGSNGKSNS
jgi:hypothetical protein